MKTLSKILIGASVVVVAAGGVAFARGPMGCGGPGMMRGAGMERMFNTFDADKDGTVTLQEVITTVDARFDQIDTNHDGVVDKAEVETWIGRRGPPQAAAHFLAMHDLDGDGKVTKAEFENPMKKRFALFDRNDDGKVTREELALAAPMGPGKHRGMMGGDGPRGMGGMGMNWMGGQQGPGPQGGAR